MKFAIPSIALFLFFVFSACKQEKAPAKVNPPEEPMARSATDSTVAAQFREAIQAFQRWRIKPVHFGDTVVAMAAHFIDRPYEAGTLDRGDRETLVLNLSSFDCTTFVEQVVALARTRRLEDPQFESWSREVERLRYRDGHCGGYSDRLHYFSEWLTAAASKGVLSYPVDGLEGKLERRALNFMGTHRSAYTRMATDSIFVNILHRENELAAHPLHVLSLDDIDDRVEAMRTGDVVAFVTRIEGLDVTHTGFIWKEGGEARLLHASTTGSVKISERSLAEYAERLKNCRGILIARPL